MSTHIVIMAGGVGSRFWPLSTPERPKQFIDVLGRGRSMLQDTVERFMPLCELENLWVVTGTDYLETVREQLPQVPPGNILSEPCARSTAPCIAYACWKIMSKDPDANLVITPSDAYVENVDEYRRIIAQALKFTAEGKRIVTIGIKPTRPETGYGYIACGEPVVAEIHKVNSFREKPNFLTAMDYLADGNYLWNAGIFVWNVKTIVESIRNFTPSLALKMDQIAEAFGTEGESARLNEVFPTCEKISIDYAVMEKADYIYTYPADFGWSDVGTWGSLRMLLGQDDNGNAVVGKNVHLHNCHGCIVHAPEAKSVVLEGLKDCVVVESEGRMLICRLSEEQRIREFGAE